MKWRNAIIVDMCMYAAAGVKKPGGTAEEVEKHFGCDSSQLIMVKYEFLLFIFY